MRGRESKRVEENKDGAGEKIGEREGERERGRDRRRVEREGETEEEWRERERQKKSGERGRQGQTPTPICPADGKQLSRAETLSLTPHTSPVSPIQLNTE